jgi:transcriptional regulator with XRE-family HTH domain
VDDFRLAAAIRQVRRSRGWRQVDLAQRSGTSQTAVSRVERGRLAGLSGGRIRAIGAALDIRVDVAPRWRGGELDRLLNHRHSALHESVSRTFAARWPAWILAPEVSFSIYGERGAIDALAWHPGRRALLVIELKTEIVDVNELLGTLDRKRRLARRIASGRGWDAATVSACLIVLNGRTNRRRVAAHETILRAALPDDRRTVLRWLRDPIGRVAGIASWPDSPHPAVRQGSSPKRRSRASDSCVAKHERPSGTGH